MLGRLRELLAGPAEEAPAMDLNLAVAVLLVEMARADFQLDPREERTIAGQLGDAFGLDAAASRALLERARDTARDSVSMHEFTRALHEGMDYAQKLKVVEMLWRVALADQRLDKYEDYLIGKLGELLYVSRGDVIRLRHKVSDPAPPDRES